MNAEDEIVRAFENKCFSLLIILHILRDVCAVSMSFK